MPTLAPAILVLEDGRTFHGESYGAEGETFGEAVFNTGMTGYQETLTDPSYHRQVVVMTAPHIGNTGVNDEDQESSRIWVAGYVVRDPARVPSNWRSRRSLDDELQAQGVVGISGIDTRALTRHLRERGAMRVGISSTETDPDALLERVRTQAEMAGAELAEEVSTGEPYVVPAIGAKRLTVAALDLGIKAMTPHRMAERGIEVHVLPATSTIDDVRAVGADGLFYSNGPGDPAATTSQVELLQGALAEGIPYFGICFGNQLFGRALGFGTYKLKYGHRGINQPVMDRTTGKVEVTAHNHGFAVDAAARRRHPDAVRRGDGEPCLPQRRRGRGTGAAGRRRGAQGLLGPVPPRGRGRSARRGVPLRPVRPADGRHRLMPKRDDIKCVLVIGSGPIIIGQACEFDYSGTQACRVLMAEGIRVVLVNSNPATIMTDPEFADATYIEPITAEFVEKVIEKERPDALLATLGGQTALNTAMDLDAAGVLEKYGVELIGASIEAIDRGENRQVFKKIVEELGGEVARSAICHSMDDCLAAVDDLGYPVVVRPSFTMGGTGSGMAHDETDLRRIAGAGLQASPTTEVLLEESILGWKEYELEVMRDTKDNVVIVCSIENLDPMGVHTGDSITVAPAMTLTDREYQAMRDLSIGIIRSVGVDTGGCNIQFAVNPLDGRLIVIEMNPRVSRSSALASKATGFPIAKIAAKVAIGYTLDEIPNDITRETPASFEPTLDYVVVKVPRFAFEKFPAADQELTTHMKSVGEAMAIGRNFTEALQKALRSLEKADAVFDWHQEWVDLDKEALLEEIKVPHDGRLKKVMDALRAGATADEVFAATHIDPWFVDQLLLINEVAAEVTGAAELTPAILRKAKRHGFSDAQIGKIRGMTADVVRGVRHALGIRPVFKTVDTCAAEFAAATPYHYSSYDEETEVRPREKPAVIILGSGPNRIGQGIEFDYSCVHASMALSEAGYETVMVNCNPETVSTDYDTSDRLYFEPLTLEDVLEIVHAEQEAGPIAGVICQLGGQTPLGLAQGLEDNGVPIVGTSPGAIHLAEERGAFGRVLAEAGLPAPKHGMATSFTEAKTIAAEIGYPVLVRPSYVLGGRGMEIVYGDEALEGYIQRATAISPEHPVLVDRFIDDAVEIDVDALFDGEELFLGGVMEHIEEAGIHSGDSSCALPPITLGESEIQRIREATEAIARGVGVLGLINIQYALGSDILYVLEANPRASRTVPFVSKATATPLAKAAARIMLGETIAGLRAAGLLPATGDGGTLPPDQPIAVKEAVMPFNRFRTPDGRQVDTVLGPEMKSTGEVMGLDANFGSAFAKSQAAAYGSLPLPVQKDRAGRVFVSMANRDKRTMIFPIKVLADMGFEILATQGTAEALRRNGVEATIVRKHFEGPGEGDERTTVQRILDGDIDLVVNTPHGSTGGGAARIDGYEIRTAAVMANIPCITTVQGLGAAVQGIEATIRGSIGVRSLQDWFPAK